MVDSEAILGWLREAGCGRIRTSGENYVGLCPYHDDSKASFSMNAETGKFICFSESCGVKGGIGWFLRSALGWSAKEVAGVVGEGDVDDADEREMPVDEWFSPVGESEVQEEPAMNEAILGIYRVCPKYMLDRKFSKSVLRKWEVGMDRDRGYVVFPVRNFRGSLVGLTKRKINEDSFGSKYLHLHFRKSHHLFGAHLTNKKEPVWVGEGNADAIALYQMGATNAVATMGARVGAEQVRLLAEYSEVRLVLDADRDGVAATKRVGDGLVRSGARNVYVAPSFEFGVKDPSRVMEQGGSLSTMESSLVDFTYWSLNA